MTALDLRPLSLGELLDRTFFLYRWNFFLFTGIAAIPYSLLFAASLGSILFTRVRIPTPFPLPVVMVEEEDGGAEVTSIVRAETTARAGTTPPPPPPQGVRKEAEKPATEPARHRIVRPMRMGKWQIAVRARWALQPSRDIRKALLEALEPATELAHQRTVRLMQIPR